jgi:hypothetical protein
MTASENRVLGGVFRPKDRIENAFKETPQYLLFDYIKRIRWAGHVARMGKMIMHTQLWLGRLKGKKSLGRPSS